MTLKHLAQVFQPTLPHRERQCQERCPLAVYDFNPRSRTGSDMPSGKWNRKIYDFNPRSRTGSDGGTGFLQIVVDGISTHAPAQGATADPPARRGERNISTQRSRTGSDRREISFSSCRAIFQPTLPHRERPFRTVGAFCLRGISTHAPAQGATVREFILALDPDISTHAPAQGATAKGYKKHPFILCKTEKNLLDNFFKDILIQKIV